MRKKILAIILIVIISCTAFGIYYFYYIFPEATKPVLKNLGIKFGRYNNETGRAGDFIFDNNTDKVFLEFGAEVMGENGPKELPTFEYLVANDTEVFSICDGIVSGLKYQEDTEDYEIWIIPALGSPWLIILDHVRDPEISQNDYVKAGDVIGIAGTYSAPFGRFEIMIVNENEGKAYAPFALFDKDLKDEYEQKVWDLMKDWEEFKGDSSIYDEDKMVYAGCLYETMDET
ncbi:MAG: hypothetical protein ACTSQS_17275 [Promethearchaeota archaeon]